MANSPICSIDECDKPVRTLKSGLCNSHERRLKRHGSPLAGGTFRAPKQLHCIIDDCNGNVFSSGLCTKHYQRNRIHGGPTAGGTEKGALLQWIHGHKDFDRDECLIWPFAGSTSHGYGHFYMNGKTVKAHRYMCELVYGPAPSPVHHAAHSCGKGHEGCTNPKHLRWATASDNSLDKLDHGTMLLGEKAPWSRLTNDDILDIRKGRGIYTQQELADRFGVSTSAIWLIQTRQRWKHI